MLNLKKMKENKCKINVMKIFNTEIEKGKMINNIDKINVKIQNTEKRKGRCIIYIYKKNVKITNTKQEKKNWIASVIKVNKKRKKNQNTFGKIMSTSNRKLIASHISNNKKIFSKSMKCMQINLVISKEYKIYLMKNVKKSKI